MDSTAITNALNDQPWLEPLADTLQAATGDVYDRAGDAGKPIKNALHGVWLGHSLHPVLTDIPLGAWTVTAVLDAVEAVSGKTTFGPGADAALNIGLLGALGSALSGITDWYQLSESEPKKIGAMHAALNGSATLLYAASSVLRKRGHRGAGHVTALVGFAIVSASAYLGGMLVAEEKLSVDHAQREPVPADGTAVCSAGDLAEGQPKAVEVDGVSVLLLRQNGTIYALGNACSHLGGPLNEGTISDGCVTCPWHGSRFALATGKVLDGPATFPQPMFQADIRDGQVFVSPVARQTEG